MLRQAFFLTLALALPLTSTGHVRAETPVAFVGEITPSLYMSIGEQGERRPDGPHAKIVYKLAEYSGVKADLQIMPWAKAYQRGLYDPDVVVLNMARTPQREQLFHWIGVIQEIDFYLIGSSDKRIELNSLADALEYRVGVVLNDFKHEFLVSRGFPNIHPATMIDRLYDRFDGSAVDLVLSSDLSLNNYCKPRNNCDSFEKKLQVTELSRQLYIAASKKSQTALVEQLRSGYQKLLDRGDLAETVNQ